MSAVGTDLANAVTKSLQRFIRELPSAIVSRTLSAIEKHPLPKISLADRRKGGQFGVRLRKLQPYNHRLSSGRIYRQAFLWGAANYLTDLPHEEMIIAFGVAEGSRIRIEQVMKIRGDSESVPLVPDQAATLHDYLNEDERRTILIVELNRFAVVVCVRRGSEDWSGTR